LRFMSQHPLVCLTFHLPIPIPAFPLKGKVHIAQCVTINPIPIPVPPRCYTCSPP
jgi:hypothetical protein